MFLKESYNGERRFPSLNQKFKEGFCQKKMNTYYKILLGIAAFEYMISPIDIIPDFIIPYLGWIDDTFIIGVVLYFMKFGRLPDFFYKRVKEAQTKFKEDFSDTKQQEEQDKKTRPKYSSHYYSEKAEKKPKQPPHEILGVLPDASKKEIQAAYRQAVKNYHPDRVAHLGKELQDLANKKFIEIKEAYNTMLNKPHR